MKQSQPFTDPQGNSPRSREEALRKKRAEKRKSDREASSQYAQDALEAKDNAETRRKERQQAWKQMEKDRAAQVQEMKKKKKQEADAITAQKENKRAKRKAFAEYMSAFAASSALMRKLEKRKTDAVRTEKELCAQAEHTAMLDKRQIEQHARTEKQQIEKDTRKAIADCDHKESAGIEQIRDTSRTARAKMDRDYHAKKFRIEQELRTTLHHLSKNSNPMERRRKETDAKKDADSALSKLDKEMHQAKRTLSVNEERQITELKRSQKRARQHIVLEEREKKNTLRTDTRHKKRQLRVRVSQKKEDAIQKADRIRRGEEES